MSNFANNENTPLLARIGKLCDAMEVIINQGMMTSNDAVVANLYKAELIELFDEVLARDFLEEETAKELRELREKVIEVGTYTSEEVDYHPATD